METNPTFCFFRLIKKVCVHGIFHHPLELIPRAGLGEDGFGKALGHKTAVSLLGDRKNQFHKGNLEGKSRLGKGKLAIFRLIFSFFTFQSTWALALRMSQGAGYDFRRNLWAVVS